MKTKLNTPKLPLYIACLGMLALLGRAALFLLGKDEKGLLIPGHPLNVLVWVLTAAAVILTLAGALKQKDTGATGGYFAPSRAAANGCFVLAGAVALTEVFGWDPWSRLDMARTALGLLAVPALVVLGLHRRKGKQPFFLFHGAACLYLILYAISHYQLWSSRPQMQYWFFDMAGAIALSLFAYYRTAFDVSMGSRRMHLATGLLAVFFCLAAVAGSGDVFLYLGGAVWALTDLCSPAPVPVESKKSIADDAREEEK